MARLVVDGGDLVVRLSRLEKLGALHGGVRVPVRAVRDVRVADDPWRELRGIRAPGTGIPRVIALGTRRGPRIEDFAAVYGSRPGVVLELKGAPFSRLVVSCGGDDDASATVERVAGAMNSRPHG